ncbi:MAG: TIR domain-containing protein, partial [Acidobacteria bacterium]|nr:TIR domain-containing protein [Acidobacteriota bacterium]
MSSAAPEQRDFFVSFTSADRAIAEWIAQELKNAGKTVYFQHWDFLPGNNFVLGMDEAARNSDRVIAVLSESYLKAKYTQAEWAAHFNADPTGVRRKVIPVRVAECEVTGLLAQLVYIDLVGCDEGRKRQRLLDGLDPGTWPPGSATRQDEIRYLQRLLTEIEQKARLYSPLEGIAQVRPGPRADPLLEAWADDPDIAILSHVPRQGDGGGGETQEYADALQAFDSVRRAVLLGEPGAGKSTTLRRRAAELARKALADPEACIPLFVPLGSWRSAEPLVRFIADQVPELGRAVEALMRAGRVALLLDGLNEMPTAQRAAKAAEIRTALGQLPKDTAVVVSCREKDYTAEADLGLDTLTLQELNPHFRFEPRVRISWMLVRINIDRGLKAAKTPAEDSTQWVT